MHPPHKTPGPRSLRLLFGKRGPRRTWHKDSDTQSLLWRIKVSVLRFALKQDPAAPHSPRLSPPELSIALYVRDHPGCTVPDIFRHAPSIRGLPYPRFRTMLLALVDRGVMRPCGRVPLEQVDARYERVPACAVCGSSSQTHTTLFWKYGTPVVRCEQCGLLYANPRWHAAHLFGRYTPEYWDRYAETVRDTAVDLQANNARWQPFLDTLAAGRRSNRLLDVGCATGEFLLAAQANGWEVYGVETSPPAAARAERLSRATVHTGTLETAPFPDAAFDAITMWDVIEHLQDPRAYLQTAARLLRPGGLLSITTPNIRSLAYFLLGPAWRPVGPNDHLYYFAPRSLARLLAECGFSIYVMHTMAAELTTWHQFLHLPALHPLAPLLRKLTLPLTNRLLLGDTIYLVAQRRPDTNL